MFIGNGYLFRSRTRSRSYDRNIVQDIFGSRCLIGSLKIDIGLEDLIWEVYCSWIDSEVGCLLIMEGFL